MWHTIRTQSTACITYASTVWVPYLIGGRWGVLQSVLHCSQMGHPDTVALPMDTFRDTRRRKRWRNPSLKTQVLATPSLDTDRHLRPRKRYRHASQEETSPASSLTLGLARTYLPPQLPDLGTVLRGNGRFDDWTRSGLSVTSECSGFVKFLRDYDWSQTVIGPMEGWTAPIRQSVYTMMSNPKARCIYFGHEDPIMLYNDACSKLLGNLHPAAMGVSGAVGAGDAWKFKFKYVKDVMSDGRAREQQDLLHSLPRDNLPLQESYFSWSIMPLVDDQGHIFGALKEIRETTEAVLAKRRNDTVKKARDMLKLVQPGVKIGTFWTEARKVIDSNLQDFPFCLMYSIPQDLHSEKVRLAAVEDVVPSPLKLESAIGLQSDHELVLDQIDVRGSGHHPLSKYFRSTWMTGEPTLLKVSDGTLPEALRIAIDDRGFGTVCHSAILHPIRGLADSGDIGFILTGLNPQRPLDIPYSEFLRVLIDQFVKIATSITVQEEREKVMLIRKRAEEQERLFQRLAQVAPGGLALVEADTGRLRFYNTTFEALINLKADENLSWDNRIPKHPDDITKSEKIWDRLVSTLSKQKETHFQFRVQMDMATSADANKPEDWKWIHAYASIERDNMGFVKWVILFLTDVTPQFEEQGKRLEDALETKRQSENFIDMTCHEMRNPLSAIIQSADGILASFDADTADALSPSNSHVLSEVQASVIDSVQTILLCAQHQKRIVDDTLTLSKLESNLLLIAPDRMQPVSLIERALQMYDAELTDAAIAWSISVDESYKGLNIDHVLLDASRLLQILINLLTNAIKFTRNRDEKRIDIVLSASLEPPSAGTRDLEFITPRASHVDIFASPEWGKGQEMYLQFEVRDTGKGLTAEEISRLFSRFQQASAKTASQHGGSGLGLFISRELAELQGGQIGVSSVAGKGTTFAFYTKVRRYQPEVSDDKATSESASDIPGVQPLQKPNAVSMTYSDAVMATACEEATKPLEPSDLHVLLVEDSIINQKVTAIGLRKKGCTVHVANHGVECLEFLEKCCYRQHSVPKIKINDELLIDSELIAPRIPLSVILLDQEMPVMDGLTCVRRIREMQRTGDLSGHIPVIACTGNARREKVSLSLEAGMDEVVTKPFRINELIPKMFETIQKIKASEARKLSTDSNDSNGSGTSIEPASGESPYSVSTATSCSSAEEEEEEEER
ncbi:hypothetical protein K504DRAFT_427362 [Pleomassaria siparia CBS 279.74]|uniref:Histidine kinase HHK15p n=1 Tax=Pleomassaria siparia CBS 279.74 TaxID=1314801 RepID=A0A6G1KJ01_9PLEO|nr:hypothetical protein K504DRAFT_427362 [Pleomassaria siparia CBS 279.74]